MLYRGMDRAALDAAYNNTAAVGPAKREQYVADWMKRSDAIRRTPSGGRRARGSTCDTATAPGIAWTFFRADDRPRPRSSTFTAGTGR